MQRLYRLHLFQPITRDKKHIALEIELLHVEVRDKQKIPNGRRQHPNR